MADIEKLQEDIKRLEERVDALSDKLDHAGKIMCQRGEDFIEALDMIIDLMARVKALELNRFPKIAQDIVDVERITGPHDENQNNPLDRRQK